MAEIASFAHTPLKEAAFVIPRAGVKQRIPSYSVLHVKMKLRILVADDNRKALHALVTALSLEFDVIATATDGRSALEEIRRLQPSVAVLDLNMPELNGIEVTREVVRQCLSCAVIICSVENAPELIEAALAAGALGYVFKTRLNHDLSIAVKHAADGKSFISAD